jgi:hypothetical protein
MFFFLLHTFKVIRFKSLKLIFFSSFRQSKLQESIQNSSQPPDQVFQSLFGKEKPGRVCCYGRTVTPSMLKKNEEIANIKKKNEGQMSSMKERVEVCESFIKMEAYI